MISDTTLHVGMLCYPRRTQLDMTGPYEVLARLPDTKVHILWKETAPVKTETGFCIVLDLELRSANGNRGNTEGVRISIQSEERFPGGICNEVKERPQKNEEVGLPIGR